MFVSSVIAFTQSCFVLHLMQFGPVEYGPKSEQITAVFVKPASINFSSLLQELNSFDAKGTNNTSILE